MVSSMLASLIEILMMSSRAEEARRSKGTRCECGRSKEIERCCAAVVMFVVKLVKHKSESLNFQFVSLYEYEMLGLKICTSAHSA